MYGIEKIMYQVLEAMIEDLIESIRDLEVSNTYMKNELKEAIFLLQELEDQR